MIYRVQTGRDPPSRVTHDHPPTRTAQRWHLHASAHPIAPFTKAGSSTWQQWQQSYPLLSAVARRLSKTTCLTWPPPHLSPFTPDEAPPSYLFQPPAMQAAYFSRLRCASAPASLSASTWLAKLSKPGQPAVAAASCCSCCKQPAACLSSLQRGSSSPSSCSSTSTSSSSMASCSHSSCAGARAVPRTRSLGRCSSTSLGAAAGGMGNAARALACSHTRSGAASRVAAAAGSSSSSSGFQQAGESSSSSSSAPRPPPSGSEISSTSNAYVKHCVKLRDSARYRQQQRRLLVAGQTLLTELTAAAAGGGLRAVTLFLKPGAMPPDGLSADSTVTVTDAVMKKLTGLEEVAGVTMAAELQMPPLADLSGPQQQPAQQPEQQPEQQLQLQRLLVLECVQDPGNLGTLLRCAAAFGWDAVWLLPGCCDPFNDKALRASRGAAFKVPLAAGSLEQLLQVVGSRGMVLLAAEPDPAAEAGSGSASTGSSRALSNSGAAPADGAFHSLPVALVLGSEGSGLSAEVLAAAQPLAVPMVGDMESLNVGVAGSILMFCLSAGWSKLTTRMQQLQLVPPP